MYISLNWLRQYIDLPKDLDPKELALKLTMATVEVEGFEAQGTGLKNVVVGKIVELKKHPNADKLRLVMTDIGGGKVVQLVCGGSNLAVDQLVAVALPGAKVRWHGQGDLVTLEVAKVRGEESFGMICASSELGLEAMFPIKSESEIIDLGNIVASIGTPLAEVLNLDDVIVEIENKSVTNRPDLWGHYGLAREVAALYDLPLKEYPLEKFKENKEIPLKVKVQDSADCPRYLGIALKGVKVGDSPAWLKARLESIGQKSINNIVDVTNFIMFELGQPLHAFSADKVIGQSIVVRKARLGEKLKTLDGDEVELFTDDLVIADKSKAIAIAGVMGGANSEIDETTNTIIIESANFDPFVIRKAANRLNKRTEAAIRFEKSLDPNLAEIAIRRAVSLILEICPEAEVASELVDAKKFKQNLGPLVLTWDFINKKIGEELDQQLIVKTLESLGFGVKQSKKGLSVSIPTWRATKDISIKEDLIEEITRVYGYDNLSPRMPIVAIDYNEQNKSRELEREVKRILTLTGGASEVYTYSFASKHYLSQLPQAMDYVEVQNPWDDNSAFLRRSLVPNLLEATARNLRYFESVNLFEVGKTFINDGKGEPVSAESEFRLPTQELFAGGVLAGGEAEKNFFALKGMIESLFERLNMKVEFGTSETFQPWCHPRQALTLLVNKREVGYLAGLHPESATIWELGDKAVGVWEINLSKLEEFYPTSAKYSPLAKFPAMELDLSLIIDENIEWRNIESIVSAVEPKLVKQIKLLDVFKNGKIKSGAKSITFRTTYQSDERTLSMDEVQTLQDRIIVQLEKGLGAEIRK